jgi:hypothetical protein
LLPLGEAGGVAGAGQHFFVARIAGQQLGIVLEAVGIAVVGAEAFHPGLRLAVDVFGGGGFDHLALPVGAGLDAEQVVAVAAVAALDLALAPARLQRRLAQHELGRDAGGLAGLFRVRRQFSWKLRTCGACEPLLVLSVAGAVLVLGCRPPQSRAAAWRPSGWPCR